MTAIGVYWMPAFAGMTTYHWIVSDPANSALRVRAGSRQS